VVAGGWQALNIYITLVPDNSLLRVLRSTVQLYLLPINPGVCVCVSRVCRVSCVSCVLCVSCVCGIIKRAALCAPATQSFAGLLSLTAAAARHRSTGVLTVNYDYPSDETKILAYITRLEPNEVSQSSPPPATISPSLSCLVPRASCVRVRVSCVVCVSA
jgi:hypothetical protein